MVRHSKTYFVLALLLSLTGCSAVASAELQTTPEAETMRQHILAWIDSFESLECQYKYRFSMESGAWQEKEEKFRYQGEWLWFESMLIGQGGFESAEPIGHTMTIGRIDGKARLLGVSGGDITGDINRQDTFRPSHVLDPRHLMGNTPAELGIKNILSQPGISFLLENEKERILMYWVDKNGELPRGINIYLDSMDKIIAVDYVLRPDCSPEEVSKFANKPISELYTLEQRLEFADYHYINGVWFPCYARKILASDSSEEIVKKTSEFIGQHRRGEIEECEMYVRILELEHENGLSDSTSEIHIDPATVRINEEMSKDDFWVDIPPGTGVVDRETDQVVHIERETWRERHANLILFMAMLLLFSIATVVGWRYWPTNDAAR